MAAPIPYVETLQAYFEGSVPELDFEHDQYLERLRKIEALLTDGRSRKYIHKIMRENYGLSRNQIYKAIRDAQLLFGNINQVNRDMVRHIAMEMALKAYRVAKKDGDAKSMTAAVNAYTKAAGLHLDQSEMPDMSKIEAPPVLAVLPEGAEQLMALIAQQGAINLNSIPDLPAEEIEFESVDDGTE